MKTFKSASTVVLLTGLTALSMTAVAQRGQAPQPPEPGRAGAQMDLSGTWVSVVTEDWRWRMVTPLIGDFANIPETEAAREIAMNWRPENDVGNECVAYGAPAIMHAPGRINISWEDDMTLRLEFDAGEQVRTFHFDKNVSPGEASRQGHSFAHWEVIDRQPVNVGLGLGAAGTNETKSLVVETTNIIPGYLRKNGIPFSDQATMTEYFDVLEIADGSTWFIVTSIVTDPVYLTEPWVTSMNFKKEADDSKWNPEPCFVMHD